MADHVKIIFGGIYREIAGKREILGEVSSGTTLRDVLTTLAKRYGRNFDEIVHPKTGRINVETWVMVNGRSVRKTDIKLEGDDVVMITVPAGGG
jgi:MoaD family protein